jgi:cyanophycinase
MRIASAIIPLTVVLWLAAPSPALAQGYVCAEGGGNPGKGAWADEVFGWMVEKGHKGPAVIIGAIALDAEDLPDNREALFKKLGAKSCTSLIINEKNADTQEIYDAITAASIVFIRGGAQERYVNWWKGTKTEEAIHAVFDKGGVIAGTSAGCAILGEVSYDSKVGSLKPTEALEDSCHKNLTLTTDFLGLVPGVLFDTHFTERGRIGRLPVMLAHVRDELHRDDIVGFGVDPRTALCVEPNGTATVRGEGNITLIEFSIGTRSLIPAGKPPLVVGAFYSSLSAGTQINMKTHAILSEMREVTPYEDDGGAYENSTIDGRGVETPVPPMEDEDKAPKPDPSKKAPFQMWPREGARAASLSVAQNTWAHAPASMTQTLRHLAIMPGAAALLLGDGNRVTVSDGRSLTVEAAGSGSGTSALVIDTRGVHEELVAWGRARVNTRVEHKTTTDDLVGQYLKDHPEEFKNLSPDQLEVKVHDLTVRFRDDPRVFKIWLDEEATYKLLDSDKQVRPSILHARLHLLPPGSSMDLSTGEVPIFTPGKPSPK